MFLAMVLTPGAVDGTLSSLANVSASALLILLTLERNFTHAVLEFKNSNCCLVLFLAPNISSRALISAETSGEIDDPIVSLAITCFHLTIHIVPLLLVHQQEYVIAHQV